jgi:N-acetylmuramoyl-L-alanine amidase
MTMAPGTIVYVVNPTTNIRSGGGTEHSIVTTASKGDKLTVTGNSGSWYKVKLSNGTEGWIRNDMVSVTAPSGGGSGTNTAPPSPM